jgi:hypothetical protein
MPGGLAAQAERLISIPTLVRLLPQACRRVLQEFVDDLLRIGPTALKTGSESSFTPVNSASSPVFAL